MAKMGPGLDKIFIHTRVLRNFLISTSKHQVFCVGLRGLFAPDLNWFGTNIFPEATFNRFKQYEISSLECYNVKKDI